jgi:hypothetical protein
VKNQSETERQTLRVIDSVIVFLNGDVHKLCNPPGDAQTE